PGAGIPSASDGTPPASREGVHRMESATRTHVRSCLAFALACVLPLALAAEPSIQADPQADAQARAQTPAISEEQQAMMDAWIRAGTPGAEHARLAVQFAGTWDVAMTFWMDPDTPPMTERGTA